MLTHDNKLGSIEYTKGKTNNIYVHRLVCFTEDEREKMLFIREFEYVFSVLCGSKIFYKKGVTV